MSRDSKTSMGTKGSHRKFAWLFGATATVCALLYWEQTALLYGLSTLAMCGLLLVVAFSKLEARNEELHSAFAEAVDTRSTQSSDLASAQKRAA